MKEIKVVKILLSIFLFYTNLLSNDIWEDSYIERTEVKTINGTDHEVVTSTSIRTQSLNMKELDRITKASAIKSTKKITLAVENAIESTKNTTFAIEKIKKQIKNSKVVNQLEEATLLQCRGTIWATNKKTRETIKLEENKFSSFMLSGRASYMTLGDITFSLQEGQPNGVYTYLSSKRPNSMIQVELSKKKPIKGPQHLLYEISSGISTREYTAMLIALCIPRKD